MSVKRIVANLEGDPDTAQNFYGELLGLEVRMDMGWIRTYGPADEPWGVPRFFVRDPFGKLVNILMHA